MAVIKRVLCSQRLRRVPEQFSWLDHRLVRDKHFAGRSAPALALYLFLVTVADAQGLSYCGGATLMQRLHLSAEDLSAARHQLLDLELVAYEAPLYQVLAIAGTIPAPPTTPPRTVEPPPVVVGDACGPVSLATLLGQLEQRRGRL